MEAYSLVISRKNRECLWRMWEYPWHITFRAKILLFRMRQGHFSRIILKKLLSIYCQKPFIVNDNIWKKYACWVRSFYIYIRIAFNLSRVGLRRKLRLQHACITITCSQIQIGTNNFLSNRSSRFFCFMPDDIWTLFMAFKNWNVSFQSHICLSNNVFFNRKLFCFKNYQLKITTQPHSPALSIP